MTPLRTPDARFRDLPGFAFQPHYAEGLPGYAGLRMHYLDETPVRRAPDMQTYLCLHGEPTWCYLYRKMIPVFTAAGHRAVAPDWFGFGRSDKPAEDSAYTFHFHRNAMLALIERLDLTNVTLVVQDWGGLLGLTLPMDAPHRFKRLLVMNTTLAVGESPGPGFDAWRAYAAANPDLPIAALMKRSTPVLSDAEAAAYEAPHPDATFKAGPRRFPQLVMTSPDMEGADTSRQAAEWWRTQWTGQSFMAIGEADPVLGPPVMDKLRQTIRGCPEPMRIKDAGHFVQEWGQPIAEAAVRAFT